MAAVSGERFQDQNPLDSINVRFSDDTDAHLSLTSGRILSALLYGAETFLTDVIFESSDPEIVRVANEAIECKQWKVLGFLMTHRFEAIEHSSDYKKIADAFAANMNLAIPSSERATYTPNR